MEAEKKQEKVLIELDLHSNNIKAEDIDAIIVVTKREDFLAVPFRIINSTILTVKNALDKAINESDLFADFCYRHCPLYKAFKILGLTPKIPCRDLCSLMRFRDYINRIVYGEG